jgi:hypothetical protein
MRPTMMAAPSRRSAPAYFRLSRGGYVGLLALAVALLVDACFLFWLTKYTSDSVDAGMILAASGLLVIAGVLLRILKDVHEDAGRRVVDPEHRSEIR